MKKLDKLFRIVISISYPDIKAMLKILKAGFGALFRVKRSIDFAAKFLLVGNTIDGFVTIDIEEFHNFEDLKSRLPTLVYTIECAGEWNIKLFQITKPYRIIKKYGYFKTPSHGKLILEYSYMDHPMKSLDFLPNKIQMICSSLEVIENWNAKSNEDFLNYGIDVEVTTVFIV